MVRCHDRLGLVRQPGDISVVSSPGLIVRRCAGDGGKAQDALVSDEEAFLVQLWQTA